MPMDWLPIILPVIPSLLSGVLLYVFKEKSDSDKKNLETQKIKQTALENAIKCLLRDRLIQAYNYHIKNEHSVQRDEYNSFVDMAAAYETLSGGNGYIKTIVEKYTKAPLKGKEGEIL